MSEQQPINHKDRRPIRSRGRRVLAPLAFAGAGAVGSLGFGALPSHATEAATGTPAGIVEQVNPTLLGQAVELPTQNFTPLAVPFEQKKDESSFSLKDAPKEFIDWFNNLDAGEKSFALTIGLLSFLPLAATAKGAKIFKDTEGSLSMRWDEVKNHYVEYPKSKWISSSAVTALTALSDVQFGTGRVDLAITFTGATILATLLPAWWALDKRTEKFNALMLQQLAPAILGLFGGLTLADNLVLHTGDFPPHVFVGAYIGYLALKGYTELGNVSRAHLRDIQNLHIDLPQSLRLVLGELETDRLPVLARDIILAVGQQRIESEMLAEGGLLDQAFKVLEEERSSRELPHDIPLEELKKLVRSDLEERVAELRAHVDNLDLPKSTRVVKRRRSRHHME